MSNILLLNNKLKHKNIKRDTTRQLRRNIAYNMAMFEKFLKPLNYRGAIMYNIGTTSKRV
ncbi:hypothetical protein FACS1894211_14360 [Clostridia bacterium]|nr:hypothetical protein FACS1894211_14360 [Clostridia bacterium]